jgi:hypothetical protein
MHRPLFLAILAAVLGLYLFLSILWEGFETIVLPRTVKRSLRFSRFYYRTSWKFTVWAAQRFCPGSRRELFLSYFGPLSLPLLLIIWAGGLILSFALIQWAQGGSAINFPRGEQGAYTSFGAELYTSGVTFFTLGYGDITPRSGLARFIAVAEAGVGFGFLALVIGYLPVLYQAFSRREATISRMDGRASSPPMGGELLRRHGQARSMDSLVVWLRDWELWSSELLESHLSYPVLTYYRSQHDHQSWIGALTAVLDACSLIIVGCKDAPPWEASLQWQARMTFAMARHAIIDLAYVFNTAPQPPDPDRLPPPDLLRLRSTLSIAGIVLNDGDDADRRLTDLRGLYEPYVHTLADFLLYTLPPWQSQGAMEDNWQTSAWEHGILSAEDLHFH